MQVQSKCGMFGFGAFGGILPTLANLAPIYITAPDTPFPAIGLYFGLLLWGIIGGGVALMNTSAEMRHAIFAGIAAPAIILNVVSGIYDGGSARVKKSDLFGFSAFAEEATPQSHSHDPLSTVIINPTVLGGVPNSVSIPVVADVIKDGKQEQVKVGEISTLRSPTLFAVPPGTRKISFIGLDGKEAKLTGTVTDVSLSVQTKPTIAGDLLWAFGLPRTYAIKTADVSVSPSRSMNFNFGLSPADGRFWQPWSDPSLRNQ